MCFNESSVADEDRCIRQFLSPFPDLVGGIVIKTLWMGVSRDLLITC